MIMCITMMITVTIIASMNLSVYYCSIIVIVIVIIIIVIIISIGRRGAAGARRQGGGAHGPVRGQALISYCKLTNAVTDLGPPHDKRICRDFASFSKCSCRKT